MRLTNKKSGQLDPKQRVSHVGRGAFLSSHFLAYFNPNVEETIISVMGFAEDSSMMKRSIAWNVSLVLFSS